jgi:hypothetical protein
MRQVRLFTKQAIFLIDEFRVKDIKTGPDADFDVRDA